MWHAGKPAMRQRMKIIRNPNKHKINKIADMLPGTVFEVTGKAGPFMKISGGHNYGLKDPNNYIVVVRLTDGELVALSPSLSSFADKDAELHINSIYEP